MVFSATLIVNSPHSFEAANQAGGLPIGLHLNLAHYDSQVALTSFKGL